MTRGAAIARALGVAAVVLAADQGTKALVRARIARGDEHELLPGVTLINGRNSGVAFGLFDDGGPLLIVVIALALCGILAFFAVSATRPRAWIPLGLLTGGALGNLVDRLLEGSVTDFIDLPAWPAFNLADVGITLGVLGMLWVMEGPRGPDRSA